MAAIDWPTSLPQSPLVNDFELNEGQGSIRVEMDSGPKFQRQRYTAVTIPFKAAMILDMTQYATFKTFYEVTSGFGSLPFNWKHPLTGTAAEVQFIADTTPETEVLSGTYIKVTSEFEVLP